jgi:DNA-binding XRE family transcriptional regulator
MPRRIELGPAMGPTEFRQAREALRLDQRGWGQALGISQRYVNLIETGKRAASLPLSDRARVAVRLGRVIGDQISRMSRKAADWRSSKRFSKAPPFEARPAPGRACECGHRNCTLNPDKDGDWQNAGHLWVFRGRICHRLVYLNERGQKTRSPGRRGLPLVPPKICSKCGQQRNLQKRSSRNLGCPIYSRNCSGRPGEHDPPTLFWEKDGRIAEVAPQALEELRAGPNSLRFFPQCHKRGCPRFGKRMIRSGRAHVKEIVTYRCSGPPKHLEYFHLPEGELAKKISAWGGYSFTDAATGQERVIESTSRPRGGYPVNVKCPVHGCVLKRKKGPWLSRRLKQNVWKMRCPIGGEFYKVAQDGTLLDWKKPPRKRPGRKPSEETPRRIKLVVAFRRLAWRMKVYASYVYPDKPGSAYQNTKTLIREHRDAIEALEKEMSIEEARANLKAAGVESSSAGGVANAKLN